MKMKRSTFVAGIVLLGVLVAAAKFTQIRQQDARVKWEREHNFGDPGDDPRFKAAEAEARRRWPEFLAALAHREPNVAYAVKAKFMDGAVHEWIWVQVASIEGNTIYGRVDNEPIDVHNVKLGDRVKVAQGDIDDWIVGRNGQVAQGGFTSKVMVQIESERKARK